MASGEKNSSGCLGYSGDIYIYMYLYIDIYTQVIR